VKTRVVDIVTRDKVEIGGGRNRACTKILDCIEGRTFRLMFDVCIMCRRRTGVRSGALAQGLLRDQGSRGGRISFAAGIPDYIDGRTIRLMVDVCIVCRRGDSVSSNALVRWLLRDQGPRGERVSFAVAWLGSELDKSGRKRASAGRLYLSKM